MLPDGRHKKISIFFEFSERPRGNEYGKAAAFPPQNEFSRQIGPSGTETGQHPDTDPIKTFRTEISRSARRRTDSADRATRSKRQSGTAFLPQKILQARSLRVKHLHPRTPQQTNIRPLVFRAETDRDLTRKTVSGGCSCEHPPEIIRASGTTCLRPQPFPNAGDHRAAYCAQRRTRLIIVCMAFRIVSSEQYSNLPWKFMPPVNRLGHGKPI